MYDTHCVTSNSNATFSKDKDKNKTKSAMIYGWICPICGKGISPYTSYCNCKYGECYTSTPTSLTSTTTLR